jgi:cytochrome c
MQLLDKTPAPVRLVRIAAISLLGLLLALSLYAQSADSAKVKKGEDLFERRCTGCHRLDEVRVGPPLHHVFGRLAGSDPGFAYSENLKASRVKWDESTLDKWLTDTEGLVPDNDMAFRLSSAEERSAIIAYLKSVSAK